MSALRLTPSGSVLLAAALAASSASAQEADVERGAYVAIAAHCETCHSGDPEKPYSGGLELDTPFGLLVTPNITPHETGIGGWSFEDFEAALRRGRGKGGAPLYPAMPYPHYTRMTDEDVAALWAYMQSVEPAENEVDVNQLPFPYNVRRSVGVWQAMYFEDTRFEPDPEASDTLNRGRYLVEALGHCGACHTPRNSLGAPQEEKALTGARIGDWFAPDITSREGSSIAKWSVDELAEFLAGDHGGSNAPAIGEMRSVIGASLSKLSEDDVRAIAEWLKARPAPAAPDPDDIPTEYNRELAEAVYAGNCESCHGADGKGAEGLAASLAGSGGVNARQPVNVISIVLMGMAPRGDYGAMPSFAGTLSNEEIAAVANHIRRSWGNEAPANASIAMVSQMRAVADEPDEDVERAMACPSVPKDQLDDTTRAEVVAMQRDGWDAETLAALYDSYAEAKPDLSRSERVVALSAAYCRAAFDEGLAKEQLMSEQLEFSNAVGDAALD